MGGNSNTGYLDLTNENLSFGVITVCTVCVLMLLANILRRKIPLFRRSLMPTAVVAGLLGLAVKEIILALTGFNIVSIVTLNGIVYHLLPVAYIALCLRDRDDYAGEDNRGRADHVPAAKSGAVVVSTYLLQGLIGLAVTVLLNITIMPRLNKGVGIMLPLGYGQGPMQAHATGYIWDTAGILDAWGPASARNYGLTIAALGFLWASIPGIILVNVIAKRKGILRNRNEFQKSGELSSYNIEGPDEIPLSESIDKFSLQVCIVGGVYLLTIGVITGVEVIFRASGINFLFELIPIFWGFAFMIAALMALCVKMVLRRLIKIKVMHRIYPNSYMMNRISGAAFDISITAALILISVTTLGTLWIPVIIMGTLGGFASIWYVRRICNHIYKNYNDEAFLGFYGTLTGTIANGMILLREIDSNFETPACDDLVLGCSAAIPFGIPLLLLIAQAPKPGNYWWVSLSIALYLAVLLVYLLKDLLFKKKKSKI